MIECIYHQYSRVLLVSGLSLSLSLLEEGRSIDVEREREKES